ncbi:nitrilase-related carbon-nitrogen hydrolase [Paralcaligenes ureilyticus]|uniref:Putative amidohydrolase n=1 Tax=Paralcaligenes ureilyticus TaxID=627131 RepID=A0A4R3LV59_9BURK|nr:nitrilase-related carbon-nitrogen hydrolase [Paralcaligenes ureilyticus]TCT02555.1 putative amidohydrolase [Paralcaligenes ureilyticus]
MLKPYLTVCMQPPVYQAQNRKDVKDNVERVAGLIDEMVFLIGRRLINRGNGGVRLVAFAEYAFTDCRQIAHGRIRGQDVAIEIPGPEIEPLRAAAKRNKIFIAAQALEKLPEFPDHCMNTMFIFGPTGELVYKRHKQRSGVLTIYTSPNDVLDRYMELFSDGRSVGETLFPVAKTEIGNLAMSACHEITTPEIARQLAANGAEVIIRSTNEPESNGWVQMDRARAMENIVYCVVVNTGYAVKDTTIGDSGSSRVIGYRGELIAESHLPDTAIWGLVDIERLRAAKGPTPIPVYANQVFDYHLRSSLPPNMFAKGPLSRVELEAELLRLKLIPEIGGPAATESAKTSVAQHP